MEIAYAQLPKLVPIGSPRVLTTNQDYTADKTQFSEVLQLEPVKRLLKKPNILLRAISKTPSKTINNNKSNNNNNNNNDNINSININNDSSNTSDTSNKNVTSLSKINKSMIDLSIASKGEYILPSKNNGKSEITLELIDNNKKICGHIENCEHIMCDVNVEQYVDEYEVSPIVAINIDESEINAPVLKHCNNNNCDALNIDHDKCRRILIQLYPCDKINKCDNCDVLFKTRKSRLIHKNCIKKNKYEHNKVDVEKLLRQRMRERELQMNELLKIKRSDYNDKLNDDNIIDRLKKNKELIVIPKHKIPPEPIITITPISKLINKLQNQQQKHKQVQPIFELNRVSSIQNSNNLHLNNNNNDVDSNKIELKLSKNSSLILPKSAASQFLNNSNNLSLISQKQNKNNINDNINQINNTNNINNNNNNNHETNKNTIPQSTIYPISIADWVRAQQEQHEQQQLEQEQLLLQQQKQQQLQQLQQQLQHHNTINNDTLKLQNNSVLMPIRIVPIANLKSEPSVLHHQLGVPKFCIVADTVPSNTKSQQYQSVPPSISKPTPTIRIAPKLPTTSFIQIQTVLPNVMPIQTTILPNTIPIQTINNNNNINQDIDNDEDDKNNNIKIDRITSFNLRRTRRNRNRAIRRRKAAAEKARLKQLNNNGDNNDIDKSNTPLKLTSKQIRGPRGSYTKRQKGEVKNFQCEYCHKKFYTDWYFKTHLARHTGELIEKCNYCDSGFTNTYDLRRHMSIDHKEHIGTTTIDGSVDIMEDDKMNYTIENDIDDENINQQINNHNNHNDDDDNNSNKQTKIVPKFKIINVNGVRSTNMKHSGDDDDDDDDEDRLIIAEDDDDDDDDDYSENEIDEPIDFDENSDLDMVIDESQSGC